MEVSMYHMRQACNKLSDEIDRSVTLPKSRVLPNFKPHLLCVAMSEWTPSTMPVTEVQVFLICFRFSRLKFSPDVAIYFLNL